MILFPPFPAVFAYKVYGMHFITNAGKCVTGRLCSLCSIISSNTPAILKLARKLTLVSFLSTLPGFVKSYFDSLYDEEIITEISFNTWESSVEEEPGKGVTVMAASEFFRWLRSATEENDEES